MIPCSAFTHGCKPKMYSNPLKDENNSGKSAKELFEEITKDKMDIFENPNKVPDMSDIKNVDIDNKGAKPGEIKLNPMFKTF